MCVMGRKYSILGDPCLKNWPKNWPKNLPTSSSVNQLEVEPARSAAKPISKMEPMLISESSKHRDQLNELVFELTAAATALRVKSSLREWSRRSAIWSVQ